MGDEADLLERARAGDVDAFAEFVRRKRLPVGALDDAAESAVVPESDPATAAEHEFLLERVRALSIEYRAPLVLRDLEGFSNEEVARILGISLAAAKSRIHRARMQIRA